MNAELLNDILNQTSHDYELGKKQPNRPSNLAKVQNLLMQAFFKKALTEEQMSQFETNLIGDGVIEDERHQNVGLESVYPAFKEQQAAYISKKQALNNQATLQL